MSGVPAPIVVWLGNIHIHESGTVLSADEDDEAQQIVSVRLVAKKHPSLRTTDIVCEVLAGHDALGVEVWCNVWEYFFSTEDRRDDAVRTEALIQCIVELLVKHVDPGWALAE